MWTTPTLLLSCSFHAPALLLPYSSPALASAQPLPYSSLFLPCSCPAHASAPLLLCSSPAPACSLAAFIMIISTLRLFSARREPPFMVCICLYICMFKICDDFSNKRAEREFWTTPFLLVPAQTFQLSIQQLTPII